MLEKMNAEDRARRVSDNIGRMNTLEEHEEPEGPAPIFVIAKYVVLVGIAWFMFGAMAGGDELISQFALMIAIVATVMFGLKLYLFYADYSDNKPPKGGQDMEPLWGGYDKY